MPMGPLDDRLFPNYEHFVLAHGRAFRTGPFPDHFACHVSLPKCCFLNAFMLVTDHSGELRYVAGFASTLGTHPSSFLHGWAVDAAGMVVDPTWNGLGTGYFGVEFDLGYVVRIAKAGRKDGFVGVLDNYREHWPLLDGRHDDWMPRKRV